MAETMTADEFEQLYRATAPELFAYLRRRDAMGAEDLAAEVYAIAWRRRADLPPPFLRRAWLFGAARNLILADARRRSRENEVAGHAATLTECAVESPNRRLDGAVAAALSRLGPDDRELILLIDWEHLTPAEVAVVLGIRPGTARVRLHRARQALAADPALREYIAERQG